MILRLVLFVAGASAHAPWCYCVPSHSFLFQFLQFGLVNSSFTAGSRYYKDIFHMFYCHTDHPTVQEVLAMVYSSLSKSHSTDCTCGCDNLRTIIVSVMGRPRSLRNLARSSIIAALQRHATERVHHLPLPKLLISFINLDFNQLKV